MANSQLVEQLNPLHPIPPVITYDMVYKLECAPVQAQVSLPTPVDDGSASVHTSLSAGTLEGGEPKPVANVVPKYEWNSPCLMVVFDGGDLNSALHHLKVSLHDPFKKNAVATLYIQESIRDVFIARLVEAMEALDPLIYKHSVYLNTVAKLNELKAQTIVGNPKTVPSHATPMLVCDLAHKYLGNGPTGVITMHTFRTANDAVKLNQEENFTYSSVSVWNEKLASAYEVCALLKNDIFMVNCYNVDLSPIMPSFTAGESNARIVKGYHYESITISQKRKIIVIAIGDIFAN